VVLMPSAGCPAHDPFTPTAGSTYPVARSASPATRRGPEGPRRASGSLSPPNPLSPREPGWPSGCPDTFPRVSVGVRCPVRGSLCTTRFRRSRCISCPHRVIRRHSGLTTELSCSSTVQSQVVHRRTFDATRFCLLNDTHVLARALRDHHHLLAHFGPTPMCASSRPSGRLFHFPSPSGFGRLSFRR